MKRETLPRLLLVMRVYFCHGSWRVYFELSRCYVAGGDLLSHA